MVEDTATENLNIRHELCCLEAVDVWNMGVGVRSTCLIVLECINKSVNTCRVDTDMSSKVEVGVRLVMPCL